MTWLIRALLIFLLVMLVVRAAWRLLGGILEGASRGNSRVPERGSRMVRDPVCGTFVVQSRALTATARGETAWFCSEDCRGRWTADRH
jgi:YHS domain-containing protein